MCGGTATVEVDYAFFSFPHGGGGRCLFRHPLPQASIELQANGPGSATRTPFMGGRWLGHADDGLAHATATLNRQR